MIDGDVLTEYLIGLWKNDECKSIIFAEFTDLEREILEIYAKPYVDELQGPRSISNRKICAELNKQGYDVGPKDVGRVLNKFRKATGIKAGF